MVLIHGFAASSCAGWVRTGWVRAPGRAGFRALGVDLPGHGRRAAPVPPGTTRTGLVDRIGELAAARTGAAREGAAAFLRRSVPPRAPGALP